MTVLTEPPIEVVWAEEAGPMTIVEDPWWEPGPLQEPDLETAWRLESVEEPATVVGDWWVDWAIPGVPRFGDMPERARPGPSAEVAAYAAAVRGLAALDPSDVDPGQAIVNLAELLASDQAMRPVRLGWLRDAGVRKLARLDDEVSVQTWARKRFDDVPREDIATAELLKAFPVLWAGVRATAVTVEAGRLAGRALKKLRPHVDRSNGLIDGQPAAEVIDAVVGNVVPLVATARMGLPDGDPVLASVLAKVGEIKAATDSELGKLERAFTVMAEWIPLRHLKGALDQQVDALLPSELEEDAERARQRRGLRMDPATRSIRLSPDDELYELLHTAIGAECRRDPENPADTDAKRELRENDDADSFVEEEGDVRFPRTREQRQHDGLKSLVQKYLVAGLAGSHDKAPVAVTVLLPLEKLEKSVGALPALGDSGRRLPSSLVSRWWCDASVTSLVMSSGMIPLGATHTQRTLTGLERKASSAQHGRACDGVRCCSPHDPLTTLVPHHVYSWAKFGKTSMVETVWLCPRLHDALHRGKTVQLRNGRWLNKVGWTDPPFTVDY